MQITIDYNGSIAKCRVTEFENPTKWVNFNEADRMTQVFAMNAMQTVIGHWKREYQQLKEK